MRRSPFFAALGFALLITGCFPTASDWRACRFSVAAVEFQGVRENQAEWQVVLAADNPGGKRLRLNGLHLFATFGADTLAVLNTSDPIEFAPYAVTRVPLKLHMPQAAWNRALRTFDWGGKNTILVSGDVFVPTWFGTHRIRNAVRTSYNVDAASLMNSMGGDLIRNLFFRK